MTWDEDLSPKQRTAAKHTGTHARLLAGPGTGKTRTLTRRILKLLIEDRVAPQNILGIAFTRINAYELRESVANELAEDRIDTPGIHTLHSYALRQLLRNSRLISSLPQPLRIADDFEESNIILPDIGKVLRLNKRQVRKKFAQLSSDWQTLEIDKPEYQPADPRFVGAWQQHRNIYGYTVRSELVWQLKHAVEENPDQFDLGDTRHLLVDEYQDLNKCDLAVIRMLACRGAEVFCAGDDDQSIYGFRGAHPAGIRRFVDEYSPSTPLSLDICWRCGRAIISVAQHVANLDPLRLDKPLGPPAHCWNGTVHLLRFYNEDQEAWGVASICRHLKDRRGYAPDDILILLRSDHQRRYSLVLESALNHQDLETNIKVDRGGPLDENAGRYLLSLMRLAANPCDDLAWRTIFCHVGRANQIGAGTVSTVCQYADAGGLRFHEVLEEVEENPGLISRGGFIQREMGAIKQLTAKLADLVDSEPPDTRDEGQRAGARKELLRRLSNFANIGIGRDTSTQEVLSYVRSRAERSNAASFAQLLDALTGPEDTLDQQVQPGKINILTMHRAKGLSARAVIIVAAEKQLIPGNAVGVQLGDERRLLYVSMTRARHDLYITYCNRREGRQKYSGSARGSPVRELTPFLRGALPVETGTDYVAGLRADEPT